MRNFRLPLTELPKKGPETALINPQIQIVGTGAGTFLWVGDEKHACYSYTRTEAGENTRRALKRFAQSILNRLSKP